MTTVDGEKGTTTTAAESANKEENDIVELGCCENESIGYEKRQRRGNEEESTTSSLEPEETTEDDNHVNSQTSAGDADDDYHDDGGVVVIDIPSDLSCPSGDDSEQDPEGKSNDDANREEMVVAPSLHRRKKKIFAMAMSFVVLLLVIAVPLGIVKSEPPDIVKQEREREERFKTHQQETERARNQAMDLIPGITNQTLHNMWLYYGPQRQAYEKIVRKDPLWDTHEDWRKQQRYGMACLFYQFYRYYGSDYKEITVSPYVHECEWMDDDHRLVATCDAREQVKGIDWIGKTWVDGRWSQRASPLEMSFLSNLHNLDCSEGMFWVGEPTDEFIERTWNDDEAFNKVFETCTHPGLELVFPSANTNSDDDDSYEDTQGNDWTLPSLKELKVGSCFGLEGITIPTTVGLLTSLTKVDLSLNELSSTVPSQLGLLTGLTSLNLHSNNLVGTLPEELGNLTSLEVLDVKENYLDKYLPMGFCHEEHIPRWSRIVTDWCWIPYHCCD